MIALDTNILVYAYQKESADNERAWAVLQELATSQSAWTVPWHCISEFIAITTTAKILEKPFSAKEVQSIVDDWLKSPGFIELSEGSKHWKALSELLLQSPRLSGRIYDLRIAALCIEHGVTELLTADRDLFSVADINVRNPLLD